MYIYCRSMWMVANSPTSITVSQWSPCKHWEFTAMFRSVKKFCILSDLQTTMFNFFRFTKSNSRDFISTTAPDKVDEIFRDVWNRRDLDSFNRNILKSILKTPARSYVNNSLFDLGFMTFPFQDLDGELPRHTISVMADIKDMEHQATCHR